MLRGSRGLVAGMIVGAALLGRVGPAAAQTATTTTTTSSTTSTTVPPHPFSPATASCVKQAQKQLRSCKRVIGSGAAGPAGCRMQFEAAFPNCFQAGAGVSCAKKCVSKETSCLAGAPTTVKTCDTNCGKTRTKDVRACRQIADGDNIWAGGDASCLGTADANFHLCEFVCSQTKADCGTSLKFCVANCHNL